MLTQKELRIVNSALESLGKTLELSVASEAPDTLNSTMALANTYAALLTVKNNFNTVKENKENKTNKSNKSKSTRIVIEKTPLMMALDSEKEKRQKAIKAVQLAEKLMIEKDMES